MNVTSVFDRFVGGITVGAFRFSPILGIGRYPFGGPTAHQGLIKKTSSRIARSSAAAVGPSQLAASFISNQTSNVAYGTFEASGDVRSSVATGDKRTFADNLFGSG